MTLPRGVLAIQGLCGIDFLDALLVAPREAVEPTGDGDTVERAADPAPPGPESSLAEHVAALPSVREAVARGRPALVHFCISGDSRRGRVCRRMQADVFDMKSSTLEGADIDCGILSKPFLCARIDVSAVAPEGHPRFNREAAPTVLVTRPDGGVAVCHEEAIDRGVLRAALAATLKAWGLDPARLLAQGKRALTEVRTLEYEQEYRAWLAVQRADPRAIKPASLTFPRDKALAGLPDAEVERRLEAARAAFAALSRLEPRRP